MRLLPILLLSTLPLTNAATSLSIPSCLRSCLDSSGVSCSRLDFLCICRSSAKGTVLVDTTTCARAECRNDNTLNLRSFFDVFQTTCGLLGVSIGDRIISSALVAATTVSAAPPVTATVTQDAALARSTITTTNAQGNTIVVVASYTLLSTVGGVRTSTLDGVSTITVMPLPSTSTTSLVRISTTSDRAAVSTVSRTAAAPTQGWGAKEGVIAGGVGAGVALLLGVL